MPMVRKLTAWVALEGHLSSSAPNRPPGSTCGTFSSSTRRVAAMANTPSLKASARLVLSMAPFSVMLLLAFVGGARHMLQTMLQAGIARTARFPVPSHIHPRCLLSGSCPQLLDAALLPSQQPVDVEPIGVGCYLCHDPGRKPYQSLGKRAFDPEDPLENGERYLCLLPHSVLAGALCNQRDSGASQRLTQLFASVGQVAKQPPGRSFPELCTTEQFAGQSDLREVGRGQLVGEGHTVGRAQEVKLHSVEGERSPPNPCCSLKPSRLLYLARMQYLKERGVYKEGLGLSDQLGDDLFPQGLKEAPELPHPPMQRGGVHPHYPREEVDEETLQVAQEGTFALHTPKLLEERQGYDFRVRELLERLVAVGGGVEQRVNVIHQAEQDRDRLFQRGEGGSMLSVSHPRFLSLGGSDGSCFIVKPRNRHLVRGSRILRS